MYGCCSIRVIPMLQKTHLLLLLNVTLQSTMYQKENRINLIPWLISQQHIFSVKQFDLLQPQPVHI